MGQNLMRRKPDYVHSFIDRHGKPRFYLRRPGFKQVPLPGLPWSPEFMAAYESALKNGSQTEIGARRAIPGTCDDIIARYFRSGRFAEFKRSTQSMRRATLERFRLEHGSKRIKMLRTEHVQRILEPLRPFAQRNLLKSLRGLMVFAVAEGIIAVDPTQAVKLKRAKEGGHVAWPPAEVERYRRHHALGSRPRLALELLLGTMAARTDMVTLGPQHVQNGYISFRRSKTGNPVDIPVLPELQEALDATQAGHLSFLVTEMGGSFTAAGFGNWFRDQCNAVEGLPRNLTAHGLRAAGAVRLAEAGCTDHEIMAWGGWKTLREVQRYTRHANRKLMAKSAADKLITRTSSGKP